LAKCPYCRKPVFLGKNERPAADAQAVRKETVGKVKKEVQYACPHCDCVLGFSFFLGGLLTGRPQ
jgi:hypothetical protein